MIGNALSYLSLAMRLIKLSTFVLFMGRLFLTKAIFLEMVVALPVASSTTLNVMAVSPSCFWILSVAALASSYFSVSSPTTFCCSAITLGEAPLF